MSDLAVMQLPDHVKLDYLKTAVNLLGETAYRLQEEKEARSIAQTRSDCRRSSSRDTYDRRRDRSPPSSRPSRDSSRQSSSRDGSPHRKRSRYKDEKDSSDTIDRLQDDLDSAEKKERRLREDRNKLKKQLNKANKKLEEKDAEHVKDMKNLNQEHNSAMNELKRQNVDLLSTKLQLQQDLQTTKQRLDKTTVAKEELENDKTRMIEEIGEKDGKIDSLASENEGMKALLAQAHAIVKKAKEEKDEWTVMRGQLESEIEMWKGQYEDLQFIKMVEQQQATGTSSECTPKEDMSEDVENVQKEVQNAIKMMNETAGHSEAEWKALQEKWSKQVEDNQELIVTNSSQKVDIMKLETELREERARVGRRDAMIQKQAAKMKQQTVVASPTLPQKLVIDESSSVTSKVNAEELDKLKKDRGRLMQIVKERDSEISELKVKLKTVEQEREKYWKQAGDAMEQRAQNAGRSKKIEFLEAHQDTLNKQVESLKERLATELTVKRKLEQSEQEAQSKALLAQEAAENEEKECARVKDVVRKWCIARKKKDLTVMKKELDRNLRPTVEKALSKGQEELSLMKRRINGALEGTVRSLEEEEETAREDMEEKEEEISEMKEKLQETEGRLKQAEVAKQALLKEQQRLTDANKALVATRAELMGENGRLRMERDGLKRRLDRWDDSNQVPDTTQDSHSAKDKKEIRDLSQTMEDQAATIAQLEQTLSSKNSDIQELSGKITYQNSKISRLKRKVSEFQGERTLGEPKIKKEQTGDALDSCSSEAKLWTPGGNNDWVVVDRMTEALKSTQKHVAALNGKINNLERDNAQLRINNAELLKRVNTLKCWIVSFERKMSKQKKQDDLTKELSSQSQRGVRNSVGNTATDGPPEGDEPPE